MNKAIFRRLAALQAFADRQRPAQVVVTFTDGSSTTTAPGTVLSIFKARGPLGEVCRVESTHPEYAGWARLLTIMLYPAPNRKIEDFEERHR